MNEWQDAATTDEELIRQWWQRWPDHGVGIATGQVSGLFVVDVDVSDGKQGDDTLADLEATYGALPPTVEVVTGSGGRHLYFRWPEGLVIRNDAGTRLGPGLDVRGEGGQVLAPPTRHPTGAHYRWEASGDPSDGVAVAEAPGWLIGLLTAASAGEPRQERPTYAGEPRPGDLFAAAVTWPDLLKADRAEYIDTRRDRSGNEYEMWARPGSDHTSATLYYGGSDVLKVFSSNWPGLTQDQTYTRFGYFVATRYGGDFARAAGDLRARQSVQEVERWALIESAPLAATEEVVEGATDGLPVPIDWATFWERDSSPSWLVEPFIPTGRHVVLYAPAKMGKSLLALEVAAGAASGKAVLGNPACEPLRVVYLDFEMTEDDLQERLSDMGYDDTSNLGNLFYYSLPSLPPLDTAAGGDAVEAIVRRHQAQLIVIDTMARVISGEENVNDTYRWFDMHVSLRMKTMGVAVLRLDHAGKDVSKGQRGASEKVGYADVVWELKVEETGAATLKATHRRLGWVPQVLTLSRVDEPSLMHLIDAGASYLPGTHEAARDLDELGAPLDITVRAALDVLKQAQRGRRNKVVQAALKFRRGAGYTPGHASRVTPPEPTPDTNDSTPSDLRDTTRDTAGHTTGAPVGGFVSPVGGHTTPHVLNEATDDGYEGLI